MIEARKEFMEEYWNLETGNWKDNKTNKQKQINYNPKLLRKVSKVIFLSVLTQFLLIPFPIFTLIQFTISSKNSLISFAKSFPDSSLIISQFISNDPSYSISSF